MKKTPKELADLIVLQECEHMGSFGGKCADCIARVIAENEPAEPERLNAAVVRRCQDWLVRNAREAADEFAPLFETNRYTWRDSGIPNADAIKDAILCMVKDLHPCDGDTLYIRSGRLAVGISRDSIGCWTAEIAFETSVSHSDSIPVEDM